MLASTDTDYENKRVLKGLTLLTYVRNIHDNFLFLGDSH